MDIKGIDQIEEVLQISLPDWYKNFIINYPEFLLETGAEDYELISYSKKLIEENENAFNNLGGSSLSKDVFIIGENGCGDYFLINLNEGEKVYSFFHDKEKFYKIADSLISFAESIPDGLYESKWGRDEFEVKDMRMKVIKKEKLAKISVVNSETKSFFNRVKDLFS